VSGHLFIMGGPEELALNLDVEDMFRKLEAQFDVFVVDSREQTSFISHVWSMRLLSNHDVEGHVYDNGGIISVDSGLDDDIALFLAWFRAYVPSDLRLFVYSSDCYCYCELMPEMAQELTAAKWLAIQQMGCDPESGHGLESASFAPQRSTMPKIEISTKSKVSLHKTKGLMDARKQQRLEEANKRRGKC
jgi:hypothetical protein